MPVHVDVVRVDWDEGTKTRVAHVQPASGDIKIDGDLEDLISRPYTDRESGKVLTPTADPVRFVERLHTVMSGSYLVATELHDDDACLFREHKSLALESTETAERCSVGSSGE